MAIFDLKANIDLKQNLNLYTTCKQLDSLNLILSVFDNSVQTNLTNYNVRLKAMKADKVPLVQQGTGISISNNVVTIECDEQLTTTSGKTLIELQFIDEVTGKKKATFNLVLIVVSTTLEVDRGISKATYTLLEELENKLDQASDFFENIDEAITANNNLQDSISTGDTLKTNLDNNITTGNTLNNDLETNISAGNILKPNLEGAVTSANTAKAELDISIQDANTFVSEHGDIIDLDNRVTQNTEQLNDKANKNLIINGEPLIWQRGTSLVNIQDFCADRWLYVCWASSSASGKIEKDFDGSMKMTDFNTTGNYIQQIIETSTSEKLANKKITLSADIKANNINTGNIYIQLVFSNGVDKIDYSGIVTHQELVIAHSDITSDYKRFKLTVDVPDTTKTISVQIGSHSTLGEVVNNDCILNIRNIKLELGAYETPFVPQLYVEELALCKRYYQEVAAVILQATFNDMREMALQSEMIEMRINPTILNVCGVNGANESMWTIQKVGVGDIGIDKTNSTFVLFNKSLLYCILKDGNNNPVGNNNTDLYTAYLKLDSEIR